MHHKFFELKEIQRGRHLPALVEKMNFPLQDEIFLLDSKARNKILDSPLSGDDRIMTPEDIKKRTD